MKSTTTQTDESQAESLFLAALEKITPTHIEQALEVQGQKKSKNPIWAQLNALVEIYFSDTSSLSAEGEPKNAKRIKKDAIIDLLWRQNPLTENLCPVEYIAKTIVRTHQFADLDASPSELSQEMVADFIKPRVCTGKSFARGTHLLEVFNPKKAKLSTFLSRALHFAFIDLARRKKRERALFSPLDAAADQNSNDGRDNGESRLAGNAADFYQSTELNNQQNPEQRAQHQSLIAQMAAIYATLTPLQQQIQDAMSDKDLTGETNTAIYKRLGITSNKFAHELKQLAKAYAALRPS